MTYSGYGSSQADPFGQADPFDGGPFGGPGGPGFQGYPPSPSPQRPSGEVNTLATLSIVFAFVFAPAGAVLGHLALSQIKRRGEPGRNRAFIGLTLSYLLIVVAVVALVLWAVLGNHSGGTPSAPTSAEVTTTRAVPPPSTRTTVITPPPPQRQTVDVEQLRVGDCVEVQQTEPDPTKADTNVIKIFPVRCEVREGVFRVDQVAATNVCQAQTVFNKEETVFACISVFKG
jgi:hypothetical protein